MFDIYEDTVEDEMSNLMEHSTCTLDISDDEGRRAAKDDRGKRTFHRLTSPLRLLSTVPWLPCRQEDLSEGMR
jgi:hypothetical protein